jgi:hypothetical protein
MNNNIKEIMFSKYTSIVLIIAIVLLFSFYYLKKIKCTKVKTHIKEEPTKSPDHLLHVYFRGLPENNQIKYIYKINSEEGGYRPYKIKENILDNSNMNANQVNYTKYESYRKKNTQREDL